MQTLDERFDGDGGEIRWTSIGNGPPIVLIRGTPYSSLIWRALVPALAAHRRVFLFDHLGYGRSEQREGQDLGIAAQGRRFARLLEHWRLDAGTCSPKTPPRDPWRRFLRHRRFGSRQPIGHRLATARNLPAPA